MHRETTIRVFGVERTIRTELAGTQRQLEAAHQRAVKAALQKMYAAVPEDEKRHLAARLDQQARRTRDSTKAESLKEAAAIVGRHRFTVPKSRWTAVRRTPRKVQYTLSVQDVLDRHSEVSHEYIQDSLPAPEPEGLVTDAADNAANKKGKTLMTSSGMTPATSDGDNRYKAIQHKLKTLGTAMDLAGNELEQLLRGMRMNAQRSEGLAVDIANAELDRKFVEMTNQVAVALGGAAVEVRKLHETAQEVAGLAHDARRMHARLYEGLDAVRSGRKERTPKPGFFAH